MLSHFTGELFWLGSLLMLGAVAVSLLLWRGAGREEALGWVYLGGLAGALIGAKLVFLFAEGWNIRNSPLFWEQLLVGRTITGALLGGYLGVEIAKRHAGIRHATGDTFAVMLPPAMILGRIGCIAFGCCLGKSCDAAWYAMADAHGDWRYPVPFVEAGFNLIFWVWAVVALQRGWQRGQLFHIYLISYGLFRVLHEIWRETPTLILSISGYQFAAMALVLLGGWRYLQRRNPSAAS